MGKRGPKKTPTAVLKLRGSWRAEERKGEPQPERGAARMHSPMPLTKDAHRMWRRLVPLLDTMGVLGKTDANALARYCETWVLWVQAKDWLVENGTTFPVRNADGKVIDVKAFPQVAMVTKFESALSRLEQQFGLTPSARAGLSVDGKKDESGKTRFFQKDRISMAS